SGAVGRSILEIAYHLLSRATTYQDLGSDYFAANHSERLKRKQPGRPPTPWLPGHPDPGTQHSFPSPFSEQATTGEATTGDSVTKIVSQCEHNATNQRRVRRNDDPPDATRGVSWRMEK